MNKPIINPITEKVIESVVNRLPQALLITGSDGVGIGVIGKYIAKLCKINPILILPEKDEVVDINNGVIGVDIIRRLYNEGRTKAVNKRIIIIDYSERMTHQAQNSFLKLLEEPNDGLHYILLSHSLTKLLPTVKSRTEILTINNINKSQTSQLLDDLKIYDTTKRSQLEFIASGLPAELIRLVDNEEYFQKRISIVRDARELLRGNKYQKLLIAHQYKDDRQSALILLNDVSHIIELSITANPQKEMISRIDDILTAHQRIESNANIRLCLAQMVI